MSSQPAEHSPPSRARSGLVGGIALAAALLVAGVIPAQAQDPAAGERSRRDEVRRQEAAAASQLDGAQATDAQLEEAVATLDHNLVVQQGKVQDAVRNTEAARQLADQRAEELAGTEEAVTELRAEVRRQAIATYTHAGGTDDLISVLEAKDFSEADERRVMASTVTGSGADVLARLRAAHQDADRAKAAAEDASVQADRRQQEAQDEEAKLAVALDQQVTARQALTERITEFQYEVDALAREEASLTNLILSKEEQARQAERQRQAEAAAAAERQRQAEAAAAAEQAQTTPAPAPSSTSTAPAPGSTSTAPAPSSTSTAPAPSSTSTAPAPGSTSTAPAPSSTSTAPETSAPSSTSTAPAPSSTQGTSAPPSTRPDPSPAPSSPPSSTRDDSGSGDGSSDGGGGTTSPAPAPAPSGGGGWVFPANGPVSSGFGYRWGRQHAGTDIDAGNGAPIMAAKSGTVISAGYNGGFGNLTLIDHGGGIVSAYAHQSRVSVSVGQSVSAGQVIGNIGSTGAVTGPHLHFEIRVNGSAVNPMNYL